MFVCGVIEGVNKQQHHASSPPTVDLPFGYFPPATERDTSTGDLDT
jgi:hypothetical protein